jgi:hypothetical protein
MKNSPFFEQTGLMVKTLPLAMSEGCFALKGGTAINFFHREMPRLSVDIDLTYLPIQDRETTLNEISKALNRIAEKIKTQYPSYKVSKKILKGENPYVFKLQVHSGKTQIKIEPNLVLRGFCYETQRLSMCKTACNFFEEEVRCMVMSPEDLYGGKICAALDRQHPRDFYDVKILLENEGITEKIMESFVVYLSSNNRPISELLSPKIIDTKTVFQREFTGMAQNPVNYDDLMDVRTTLIRTINKTLTNDQRHLLLSVKEGLPKFDLLKVSDIEKLPAIQWKIKNIQKMDKLKHKEAVEKLRYALGI